MKECEWCTYKEKEFLLFETSYWKVYLADVQDYIGRCIVVLKRHCGNMSELNMQEWIELKEAIDVLELCFNSVLGAELCNWSCLMNSFYKDENPNPHLHIHVRPRYSKPVEINNHSYKDEEFSHHYKLKKKMIINNEDKKELFKRMIVFINQHNI